MFLFARAAAPNIVKRVFLQDSSSTTGAGLTGLTSASSGLAISIIRELDAAPTNYSVAGATIESITTLGTYAAPTATKVRFKEVDATNLPGVYELHIAQALGGTGDASRHLVGLVRGATNLAPCPFEILLTAADVQDAVALGLSRIDAAISSRMATFTLPANFSALSINASGLVDILQSAADKVWSTATRALTDKVGFALSVSGVQAIWDALTSALTTAGSIGKRIADNLDATVSSRGTSTYAGTDTAGTTTLLARLTAGRATNLDNLDAAVSTRSTYAGADTAGTTTLLGRVPGVVPVAADYTAARAAKLDNLDAAISTIATPAQVKTQVVAALVTDTYAELAAVPAATSSLKDKLSYVFTKSRNKVTQTSTTQLVRNDADTATIATATVSDDNVTFVKTKDV